MEILVKPHSHVSVITNSSTVIYTQFHDSAVTETYELINEVLKVAGSDKKAEDLFDVSVHPDMDRVHDYLGDLDGDDMEDIANNEELLSILREYCNYRTKYNAAEIKWEVFSKWEDDVLIPILEKDGNWKLFIDDETNMDTYLKIVSKDESKSTKDLGKLISNMFSCEDGYE